MHELPRPQTDTRRLGSLLRRHRDMDAHVVTLLITDLSALMADAENYAGVWELSEALQRHESGDSSNSRKLLPGEYMAVMAKDDPRQ